MPEEHGFVRVSDFKCGGTVDLYELQNHPRVDGQVDLCRLNLMMSKDGVFVNIWFGLAEPIMAEARFKDFVERTGVSFAQQYEEPLFRGYIHTAEEAEVILRAIRSYLGRCPMPQILTGGPDELRCDTLK